MSSYSVEYLVVVFHTHTHTICASVYANNGLSYFLTYFLFAIIKREREINITERVSDARSESFSVGSLLIDSEIPCAPGKKGTIKTYNFVATVRPAPQYIIKPETLAFIYFL